MKEFKLGIKDLIFIITLVVSVCGTYFTLNYKTQMLEVKVEQLENKHDITNIEVLQNDLNYVKTDINEIKLTLKEQLIMFNDYLLGE